jgi:DNA/RNA endonuclease YhcR with UshA esterase domain
MGRLLKISFIISISGILLLLLLSDMMQPELVEIKNIDNKLLGKKVRAEGKILNIKNFEDSDFQIISMEDETGKIDVTSDKLTNLEKNKEILVTGTVTEYNESIQIRADIITLPS